MNAVTVAAEGEGVVVGAVDGKGVAPAASALLATADVKDVTAEDDGAAGVLRQFGMPATFSVKFLV